MHWSSLFLDLLVLDLLCKAPNSRIISGSAGITGSAGVEDATLPLGVWQTLTLCLSIRLHLLVAGVQRVLRRLCQRTRGRPARAIRKEDALLGVQAVEATAFQRLYRIIILIAIEVPAPAVLRTRGLLGMDDCIQIVWSQQTIDGQPFLLELEKERRQIPFRPADRVPGVAVPLIRVHRSERGLHVIVNGLERPFPLAGLSLPEDLLAIPINGEVLSTLTLIATNILHGEGVLPDELATDGDAHGRCLLREALGDVESTLNKQLRRLDQPNLSRNVVAHLRAIRSVKGDDVRVAHEHAFAPWPSPQDLCKVRSTRLALAREDVFFAKALPAVLSVNNGFAIIGRNATFPALFGRHLRTIRVRGQVHSRSSLTVAIQVALEGLIATCQSVCGDIARIPLAKQVSVPLLRKIAVGTRQCAAACGHR
mmetsp:Transcript_71389/g.180188  ORF Transcript_71389/g.180188 Transcript_71389/m.180188 type:complete len:424 (+) Transcript_71389:154-1425(+)